MERSPEPAFLQIRFNIRPQTEIGHGDQRTGRRQPPHRGCSQTLGRSERDPLMAFLKNPFEQRDKEKARSGR